MKNCPTKGKIIISLIAVFIFTFVYDWFVYGQLMMPLFNETPNLWRPMEQMQNFMPHCLIYHFVNALVFVSLFSCYLTYAKTACQVEVSGDGKKPCWISKSVCFGTGLGILLGVNAASTYIWMPISLELALAWLVAATVKGAGVGTVVSMTMCKKKEVV